MESRSQAVIQGVIRTSSGVPVRGYARLLDSTDEFVAEVPLSATGEYRFFAGDGNWQVRVISANSPATVEVIAAIGQVTDLDITTN
jgi:hypothetical protein